MVNDFSQVYVRSCISFDSCLFVRIRPSDEHTPYARCARNEPKIILADGKTFIFDYVYDMFAEQANIYESVIDRLVKRSLEGFNATVLAYRQVKFNKNCLKFASNDFILRLERGKRILWELVSKRPNT